MEKNTELFYLQDSRSFVGSNVVFWNIGGHGYGTNLDKIQTYTSEQAQRMHSNRITDIPLSMPLVDKLSIKAVDHQYLPEKGNIDPNNEYVVQVNGDWNGNDIYFISQCGASSNYNFAVIFSRKETIKLFSNTGIYSVFSKESIGKISRRTFQVENINRMKMTLLKHWVAGKPVHKQS